MRRFFLEYIDPTSDRVSITGGEARHIATVLRMAKGDRLFLLDGRGNRYLAVIEEAGPKRIEARLEESVPRPAPPDVSAVLCQSLLKSDRFEYVIQKTSELGVSTICPFYSERTIVRLQNDRLKLKMKRWLEIAKASVKQSGRDTTVLIEEPVDLRELMSRWCKVDCLKLFLWEGEEKNDIKGVLKGTGSKSVVVAVVGPEGGFSKKEVEYARDAGFITASFGERTLRADTAAISLVAIVQYEFGCLAPGFASAC